MQDRDTTTSQATILVVDDTPANLGVLLDQLEAENFKVLIAMNGESALETISHMQPDLILLDVMMPGIDGFETCRRLKADETTQDIPVIFMTALTDVMDEVQGLKLGAVDYISKPIRIETVSARLHTHLTLRNLQKRLEFQNTQLQQEIVERTRAEEALQQRNHELLLLNQVSQMFSSSLDLEPVLDTALDAIQRLLNVYSLSFWLIEPETHELVCMQASGPGSDDLAGQHLKPGQGITGWVAWHNTLAFVPDLWEDERHVRRVDTHTGVSIRSMLSLPLQVKGKVIGVLNLADLRVGHFSQEDVIMLEPIAAAAAIAIENARLYMMAQQEIAERKKAEAALREAHGELQELNASKDKFFSIISHDLRSPFSILLGFTQLLEENLEQYSYEENRSKVAHIRASAERLYALLENLLTWSRIQRGAMEHQPETIDLAEIAEDNVALFAPKAEHKQITLRSAIPENTLAYADYSMVDTVLRNLISNALKFTPAEGRIDVSASVRAPYIEVAVSDIGRGIPFEDISKLFRIDVQYTNPGTAGEKGTGLGLILCQELVERNGGKIWVESEIGKGTTFTFTLPGINSKQ